MKKKYILLTALSLAYLQVEAQIKFDPSIDPVFESDTIVVPKSPLKTQILFRGGYDMVESNATYGNPAGKYTSKSWNDFIGFTKDENSSDLGWISVNHEQVVANDNLGDGGGMTVFKVKRDPSNDTLIIVEQQLQDGRKGQFFNVDFANTTGETGMNCGGIQSSVDGRIWTAEEWFRYGNSDLADRDTSDFIIGTGTVNGYKSPAGFPGFNGQTVKKFENYNYMTDIDPKNAVAIRKQYNWGRQPFEGGAILSDNKTVILGADNTPGYLTKFVADVAGDFTQGKLYVYRHNDSKVKLNHFSSATSAFAEISAYDEVNKRLYSTNSKDIGVNVYDFVNGNVIYNNFIDLSTYGGVPNSVAVNNGILAVALPNVVKTNNGVVVLIDKNLSILKTLTVGALPDMLTYSPDGKNLVVANEGEPNDEYTIDPEGSVSIIDMSNGAANATARNVGFTGVSIDPEVRIFGKITTKALDLFFSEYAEGTSNNKYLEIYNGTAQSIDLTNYAFPNVSNAPTTPGEYEFWNTFPSGASIPAGKTYIIAHGMADSSILAKADYTMNFLSNGDDGFALVKGGTWIDADMDNMIDAGEMTNFTVLDMIGDFMGDPGDGWDVAGTALATKDHTLVRKSSFYGNSNWTQSAGTDVNNSEWIVKANEDWTNLGAHTITTGVKASTPAQDLEPEYVAISTDSKKAYVSCQENNAIAIVDLTSGVITSVKSLGFKNHGLLENSLDASDRDGGKGISVAYNNVLGMYQPDAIAVANIGGVDYIVSANEGDSRDYPGFSEEARVKDLVLDPTAFPDWVNLRKDQNLGRLKTTTTLGDTDGDGDYDKIYAYGARSFAIWDTTGTLVYDSKNEIEKILATQASYNYPADRDDDKGAEPESVAIAKLENKTFAFIGLERAKGVMVFDISNPKAPVFVQYYNKDEIDQSPEGLVFIPASKSGDGQSYLISTNEASGNYEGSVSSYQVSGLDNKKWIEINSKDLEKMVDFQEIATGLGATMYNRLEWVTYDKVTGKVYMTETGRDNPGSAFAEGANGGGQFAPHHLYRAAQQATTVTGSDYWDYYGRILVYDPATQEVTVHLEAGPYFSNSPSLNNYPEKHLSNPDGLNILSVNGKRYLTICEDLNGRSYGRVPAGVTSSVCELYLLDLDIKGPEISDLIRVSVAPKGAEITGACATPDGKTLLVNAQHPSTTNPFPYNYSLTYAITGWDTDVTASLNTPVKQDWSMYPNPVSRVLNLSTEMDVAFYNMQGQRLMVYRNVKTIDVSDLTPGTYIIKTNKGETKKLIIE